MARKQHVQPRPVQRGDGSIVWRVRFRLISGANPVSETFDDQMQAIRFAEIVNLAGGVAARKARDAAANGESRSMRTALEAYLQHAGASVQPDTVDKYRRTWDRYIAPTFDVWPVEAVSRQAVEAWITGLREAETVTSQRRKTGPPDYLSPKTISNVHGLLSSVFNHEVIEFGLATNPAFKIRLPAKQKKREAVFLTQSAYASLIGEIPVEWQTLVNVLAGTGLRWGEVTALRLEDVDLDGPMPVIRVTRAWKRGRGAWVEGTPKTPQSTRSVSLSASVARLLSEWVEDVAPGELLFTGPQGGRLRGEWFQERVWHPAVKSANLSRNPVLHDLRHSHASWLIGQGVPLPYVQRRLGHSSIKVTSDVYGHIAPDAWEATARATETAMTLALPAVEEVLELEA